MKYYPSCSSYRYWRIVGHLLMNIIQPSLLPYASITTCVYKLPKTPSMVSNIENKTFWNHKEHICSFTIPRIQLTVFSNWNLNSRILASIYLRVQNKWTAYSLNGSFSDKNNQSTCKKCDFHNKHSECNFWNKLKNHCLMAEHQS